MREDMVQVVHRLGQARAEEITQAIEEDILTALQEIIDALKKAQKERSKSRSPRGRGLPASRGAAADRHLGRDEDDPRLAVADQPPHGAISKLIVGEQAEQADLLDALRRLGQQEQRIYRHHPRP